jgi:hypothetical protein
MATTKQLRHRYLRQCWKPLLVFTKKGCRRRNDYIDLADDAVLHVTNTYAEPEDAERAARTWIQTNG